jgi:phage recombination protein Bet
MSTHEDRTGGELVQFQRPRLPYHDRIGETFGIEKAAWRALVEAVFPLANTVDSVVLALSYCKARNLDPFKRVVHIVPMWDSGKKKFVDTVWPSVAELRITAHRTGEYAGCDETEFGPEITRTFEGSTDKGKITKTVTFPEWARVTVYRFRNGHMGKFVGPRVKWLESYATIGRTDVPNEMWCDRPDGQIEKCAEAAVLRKAFPEELGNTYAAEEMHGRRIIESTPVPQSLAAPEKAKKPTPRTLDQVAEVFAPDAPDDAPLPDRPRTASLRQADAQELPPEDVTPSGGDIEEEAYDDGYRAQRRNVTLKGLPARYKNQPALAAQWQKGWRDAKAEEEEGADDE